MGEKEMMQYLWMFFAAVMAFGKGRGMIRWAIAGYFFGWFVPIILLFLPIKLNEVKRREAMIADWAEGLVAKKQFEGMNTVDDLIKQLKNPKG
jgi:hypothetical protein